jgi:hypothetical protein
MWPIDCNRSPSRPDALFGDIQYRMLEYDTIMYQLGRRRESALALDLVRTGRSCFSGV